MPGYAPSLNASPLHGAIVALVCRSKLGITYHGNSATDTKGYFFIKVQNIKKPSVMPGTCKVVVRPPAFCNKPIIPKNLQYGVPPKYERTEKAGSSKLVLFTVGFLEYGPSRPGLCPRQR
ncbi:uncharacterized protein LOC109843504 [Asparagus officinalis]|uniref:uncharacterized protein LOC109843504 n=1 Tax=Asparagus officinalis TaxID=4686 RepID=UPI00098DFC1B|nr:uncharacterized protein LOC109843504 [Asparagus officinalis]